MNIKIYNNQAIDKSSFKIKSKNLGAVIKDVQSSNERKCNSKIFVISALCYHISRYKIKGNKIICFNFNDEQKESKPPIDQISFPISIEIKYQNSIEGYLKKVDGLYKKSVLTTKNNTADEQVTLDQSTMQIAFEIIQVKDDLQLRVHYIESLYEHEFISRMINNFEITLSSMLNVDRQKNLGMVSFLNPTEASFLKSSSISDLSRADKSILLSIEEKSKELHDKIALSCDQFTYTYQEMWSEARHISDYFISNGFKQSKISLHFIKSCRTITVILGILLSGNIYVPISTKLKNRSKKYILKNSNTAIYISDDELHDSIPRLNYDELLKNNSRSNDFLINDNSIAYILYTSGTTGNPKGVQVTHSNLNNVINFFTQELSLNESVKTLSLTSVGFDIFGLEVFCSLVCGGTLYLCRDDCLSDVQYIHKKIENLKINFIQATPTTWSYILKDYETSFQLDNILFGGEAIPQNVFEKIKSISKNIYQVYGPTETTIWSTIEKISDLSLSTTIGKPISGTSTYILDKDFKPLPLGVYGEIYISGVGVSSGYYKNSEANEKSFMNNKIIMGDNLDIIYKTGDIARFNSNGTIEFKGRIDNQIKILGNRVELDYINKVICKSLNLRLCYSKIDGEGVNAKIISFIEAPDLSLSTPQIISILSEVLDVSMLPSCIYKIKSFPLTENYKIDYKKLLQMKYSKTVKKVDRTKFNKNEEIIHGFFSEITNNNSFGLEDSLIGIGVNSLSLLILLDKLEKYFGVKLSITDIYQNQTVKEIDQIIHNKMESEVLTSRTN